jgi:hypothetical protein
MAIRHKEIGVDFVDRYPELSRLFAAAVREAQTRGPRAVIGRLSIPVAPKDFLVAMKVGTNEDKDERDAQRLLGTIPVEEYRPLRSLVRRYLGPAGAIRLDVIAAKIGHPGPKAGGYNQNKQ